MTTDGVPLGLVAEILWARDPDTQGKSADRKQRPIEDKESYRWRIERLHFALKSGGSQVERLQLETRERLERAITLYTIVAWRILWMTYQVRINPDQSPTVAFSADEIDALERVAATQSPARRSGQPFTLRDAVRAIRAERN